MPKPQSYFKTLGDSFLLLKKFPQLFIPAIIGFLAGLASTLFTNRFLAEFTRESAFKLELLVQFVLVILVINFVGFIIYGWQFSILKQIFKTKKIGTGASLKNAFSMAWKVFKIGLLMALVALLFFLAVTIIVLIGVGISIGMFKLNAAAGIIISIILGLIGFGLLLALMVLFFLSLCYSFHLMPVIALEDKRAWATIVHTYYQFRKNIGFWAKNGILSVIIIMIAEIPYFVYLFMSGAIATPPTSLYRITIAQITIIPSIILSLAILVAYCFFYKEKK
ncbi:MAG TPA: hypothetical protein VJG49_03975 [Candidatus Nanoarchaeia archaeon]|nr:hypothetical protein [Candidatus Nanoarchaeia archaeon]